MPFFKCDDIKACTGGTWTNYDPSNRPDIRGFSTDSRNMEKNFAFVALKGARDGCDFAASAVENGASAVIAERELPDIPVPTLVVENPLKALWQIAKIHRLRFDNPVVGITGSCGKTSTKEMLKILTGWRNPAVTEKNYNNEIGVPLTLTKIDMRDNRLAIVEAGVAAPGQMEPLAEMIEPDIAIITNVGLTHLEKFSEIANVAREKAVLASHCAQNGWCLMHHSLLSWKAFDELKCKRAVVAPAETPEFKADLIFRYSVNERDGYSEIDMCVEGGDEYCFEISKMSQGMTENAVLAFAAALMLGAREENLSTKLRNFSPLPMRGGVVELEKSSWLVDCYNASPTSMRDSLARFALLSEQSPKRVYVLGDMAELGLASLRHHKETASRIPYRDGDAAVLIGKNVNIYKEGLLSSGWPESSILCFDEPEKAKNYLENFEGFAFVKGSRICHLEDSLPDSVREKISLTNSEVENSEKTEDLPEEDPSEEDSSQPKEEAKEEDKEEDEFSEYENFELEPEIDDEDDREKI